MAPVYLGWGLIFRGCQSKTDNTSHEPNSRLNDGQFGMVLAIPSLRFFAL
jgi:hypothetical protein